MLTDRTDDELMLLARGGVEGAFDALIRRHQGRLLRLALAYTGSPALAADIAQDTFVALFRALPQYRAQGKFSAYVYSLLLNQCRMTQRAARTEARALDVLSREQNSTSSDVLRQEYRRDLEAALQGLSAKLRDAVLLRFAADLGFDEVAETLAIPVGSAKRRVFDAMAKLRDLLGES
ncbi:MAG TPA: RNA polymerase sigma factor [Polyangiaceae bacterium]|jgi:RNA polymerase sigma-70 factor (ECF subfamily)|nr:RNA polymerase sigma factor [Polyangiaceae bacterium]